MSGGECRRSLLLKPRRRLVRGGRSHAGCCCRWRADRRAAELWRAGWILPGLGAVAGRRRGWERVGWRRDTLGLECPARNRTGGRNISRGLSAVDGHWGRTGHDGHGRADGIGERIRRCEISRERFAVGANALIRHRLRCPTGGDGAPWDDCRWQGGCLPIRRRAGWGCGRGASWDGWRRGLGPRRPLGGEQHQRQQGPEGAQEPPPPPAARSPLPMSASMPHATPSWRDDGVCSQIRRRMRSEFLPPGIHPAEEIPHALPRRRGLDELCGSDAFSSCPRVSP